MLKISKVNLILIFLITFIIFSGFFAVKWAQKGIKEVKTEKRIKEGVENKKADVTITTDKTEYKQGETIRIAIRNNKDKSIWYIDFIPQEFTFWEIEKIEDKKWENYLYFFLPVEKDGKEVCRTKFYEQPITYVAELKPHFEFFYEWNQKICPFKKGTVPFEPVLIGKGHYRFIFKYGLSTVHLQKPEEEPWKRKVDLADVEVIRSNEFTIR